MQYFANSDRGRVRPYNQDRTLILPLDGGVLLAVFDGMGGHAEGDVAAELAAETFRELFTATPPKDRRTGEARLLAAARTADERIRHYAAAREERAGMGTTVTALLLLDGTVTILNVGDSRTYLFRQGELYHLTHDDSYVQSLVDAGTLAPADVRFHPRRNVITRALGSLGRQEPSLLDGMARRGDTYLLCSDGLWEMLSEGRMSRILSQQLSPAVAVGYLIATANECGGEDNIGVALLQI